MFEKILAWVNITPLGSPVLPLEKMTVATSLTSFLSPFTNNNLIKNSNAVIYFWPTELGRIELLKEKLHYLEKHHPEVVFIGIERNKTDEEWKEFISSKKLPEGSQFKLAKDSESYDWYEGDMARTIIVNNEGKVENGYVFFLDSNLNYYLKNINKH